MLLVFISETCVTWPVLVSVLWVFARNSECVYALLLISAPPLLSIGEQWVSMCLTTYHYSTRNEENTWAAFHAKFTHRLNSFRNLFRSGRWAAGHFQVLLLTHRWWAEGKGEGGSLTLLCGKGSDHMFSRSVRAVFHQVKISCEMGKKIWQAHTLQPLFAPVFLIEEGLLIFHSSCYARGFPCVVNRKLSSSQNAVSSLHSLLSLLLHSQNTCADLSGMGC